MITINNIEEITPTNHDPFDLPIGGEFRYKIDLNDKRSLIIYAHVSYPKVKILSLDISFNNYSSDYDWDLYPYKLMQHVSLRFAKRMLKEMRKTGHYDEVFVKYLKRS